MNGEAWAPSSGHRRRQERQSAGSKAEISRRQILEHAHTAQPPTSSSG